MTQIAKTFIFHAAHRLRRHNGGCHNIHGHTYRVDIVIDGPVNEDEESVEYGMVLDFGVLKMIWKVIEPEVDHTILLEHDDPIIEVLNTLPMEDAVTITMLDDTPTAENISWWLHGRISEALGKINPMIHVASVRVWETATSWAEA